jgi:hypothetical protein
VAAILVGGLKCQTQFWKGTTQELKIEISSNGQNCSILSPKVPKFELYKHNDELFNKYPFEEISIFSNGGHLG